MLRKTLEVGTQTLVQLPSRYPQPEYSRKELMALASALVKLAANVSSKLSEKELRKRIDFILSEDPIKRTRLGHLAEELQWAGESLRSIGKVKLRRLTTSSPNPQVDLALYLVGWLRACTGRPNYTLLKTLVQAAFDSAHKTLPKWVERLEIEMNLRKRRRVRAISN